MNIRGVKAAEERIESAEVSSLHIQAYGNDNLYPQRLRRMIRASQPGSTCADRYARFIEGGGFRDARLWKYAVNDRGDRMDDVLKSIAADYAMYNGFALHLNYNVLGKIVSVAHIPFENCRIGMPDDTGYVSKIAVHPDWAGKRKRNGTALKPTESTIDYIDVYNPLPTVVAAQVTAAGGIEHYKGQVLYVSADGRYVYPTPKADCAITDLSTDEGLGNIRYRNTRFNFLPSGMLVIRRGKSIDDETEQDFVQGFNKFQGDDVACKIMTAVIEEDEEPPEFVPFEGKNYDEDFALTDKKTEDRIYSAFEQEVFLRIKEGAFGFSSDIIRQAYEYYASLVESEQRMISRVFSSIFELWFEPVGNDFGILPLKYKQNEPSGNAGSGAGTHP